MAITTMAGVRSGMMAPIPYMKSNVSATNGTAGRTHWAATVQPAAGAYDSTLNGVSLTATSGRIPFVNPASGNTYFAGLHSMAQTYANAPIGLYMICDRLWHNGGMDVTSTSAQSITSPTWPARDVSGSTNGEGVFLMLEISATVGAGTPTITISYTNSSGTSGRTATNIAATVASSGTGTAYAIGLQAGDTGVRSVQSLTLSATWTSGTMNLVAYRPLAVCALIPFNEDALTIGFPRVYDDSVLYGVHDSTSTNSNAVTAQILLAQG